MVTTKPKLYELLAAAIYKQVSGSAIVKHDDKIIGRNSETERQIDVSIRATVGPHDILTIVECKHHGRKIDVNTVGAFLSVVEDVQASKGVLVSNSGFTKSARRLADSHCIDLCSLHDAQSMDWRIALKIPVVIREVVPYLKVEKKGGPSETALTKNEAAELVRHVYEAYFNWFVEVWPNEAPSGDEQGVAEKFDQVYDAVIPPHLVNTISIVDAGAIYTSECYVGFIDEFSSSKGIFNLSEQRYALTYNSKEILYARNSGELLEVRFNTKLHKRFVRMDVVMEPLIAFRE